MIPDPRPGLRVVVTDPESTRRGSLGTIIRYSPSRPGHDGQPLVAFVFIKLDDCIWTLPFRPEDLEIL